MTDDLVADLLDGDHRALARVITMIENRTDGYRDVVAALHEHTGSADVVGVTGSPGAGKSTLVDKAVAQYRERGETVGVVAIDPSSPFSGGSVLGDRVRLAETAGDMDVFFRSMSTRGSLGGLSTATTEAVTALDAFGKDKVIVETVGAGQSEVDVVRTADTVAVLVPPGSGDDVQMLKAGILEIADVFVVNKADLEGADRTVRQLRELLQYRDDGQAGGADANRRHGRGGDAKAAHGTDSAHGEDADADSAHGEGERADSAENEDPAWDPPIVETVATTGEGVDEFVGTVDDHLAHLDRTGQRAAVARERYASEIRTLLREEVEDLLAAEIESRGGLDRYVDAVLEREADPYSVTAELLEPFRECPDGGQDPERGTE